MGAPPPVLQSFPASEGAVAYLGTFLLAAAFYALTAHVAARYVLGDVPARPALPVGAALAVVSLLLRPFGAAVVVPLTVAADALAVRAAYGLDYRDTALVVLGHVVVSVVLGLALFNLVRLLVAG